MGAGEASRIVILPRREMVGAMKPLTWTALPLATRETAATAERERYKRGKTSAKLLLWANSDEASGRKLGHGRNFAYRGPGQLAEHVGWLVVAQLGTPDTGRDLGRTEGFGGKS